MSDDYTPCRFGEHCRTRNQDGPGEATSRGLCWPCEAHGRFAITQLPADYRLAAERLAPSSTSAVGVIPTARAEAPVPVNLAYDELMRAIVWELSVWEIAVRDTARLYDAAEKRVRPFVAVARGAQTLVDHYSVLLALRGVQHMPYVGDSSGLTSAANTAELDGPDAVVRLAALHHRTVGMVGLTTRREPRRLPCPAPVDPEKPVYDDGCGQAELGSYPGYNVVDCWSCGWKCSRDEYELYALTLTPPARRRDDPVLEYRAAA